MIKKVLIGILFAILIAFPAYAIDLSDFPNMFLGDVRIIVGRAAKAEDVLGAIDITVALQQRLGRNRRLEGAVLDTEVDDLSAKNAIIVGGPCINSAAAKIMGYPQNCLEGFELGKGIIKLYELETGNYILLAAGTTALDTRRVTSVLANYNEYALSGNEMIITGMSISQVNVDIK